eukprot:NODE_4792_length_640_cov_422.651282.p1 GENE.NODE_4792_length_640_cov_422.651282~~NODE_4792_length_640_cov_422.651282.p1  ORF type:complete len:184 (+),score=56.36 NODE_4792_length_640_cov_422.651282:3-554(+)
MGAPYTPSQPWLLKVFDILVWEPVSEEKLLEIRRQIVAGQYTYDIRDTTFCMAEQNKLEESVREEAEAMTKRHLEAQAGQLELEGEILERQDSSRAVVAAPATATVVPEGQEAIETDLSGTVLKVHVKPGDAVVDDETIVCTIEAMKMEVAVKASVSGTVDRVLAVEGLQVRSGDVLCSVRPA